MTSRRTPTEMVLTLFQVYPTEQAVAQVAAMDPRVASEVYQQMLDSGGSVTLQEATRATLAGMPSATVTGAPTVNNLLAMTRFNVVNVNTSTGDEELRRELQQREFLLSEHARREAELEALRFRQIYEREASESIAATKVAAEQAMLNVQQRAQQQEQSVQQMAQQQDNVAIKRLQGTLEEQREHFQQRLAQATMARERVVQEKNALAEEGNMFVERLKSEHRQYVEQQESRLKAAVEATEQARSTSAEEARKVIDLDFKREELTSSLAIAQAKIKSLISEMEAAKKQNDVDKGYQEQTIVELRKDNAMLKGEMDELRRVVQALTDREEERKETKCKAQAESPVKPGPQHPEPPPLHAQADIFAIGQPRSLGPLRTEGPIPATVEGSPPDAGGIPVKTARMQMQPIAIQDFLQCSLEQGRLQQSKLQIRRTSEKLMHQILGQNIGRSRRNTTSAMTLCTKAPLTRTPNKTKMTAKKKGRHLRYELPKNKI